MASASANKNTKSRTNTSTKERKTTSAKSKKRPVRKEVDVAVKNEVALIIIFAAAIFTFLCVINLIHGSLADGIRNIMFGLFGLLAYVIPIIIFLGFAFGISNKGNTVAIIKMVSAVVLIFLAGIVSYMIMKQDDMLTQGALITSLYQTSSTYKAGGGVIFGIIAHGMYKLIGFVGTMFVVIVLGIISLVFITEKSVLSGIRKGGSYFIESAKEDAARMREYRQQSLEEYEDYEDYEEVPKLKAHSGNKEVRVKPVKREEKSRRVDKKARGVISSASVTLPAKDKSLGAKADIHEIVLLDNGGENTMREDIHISPYDESPDIEYPVNEETYDNAEDSFSQEVEVLPEDNWSPKPVKKSFLDELDELEEQEKEDTFTQNEPIISPLEEKTSDIHESELNSMPEPVTEMTPRKHTSVNKEDKEEIAKEEVNIARQIQKSENQTQKYVFPPVTLLNPGDGKKGDSVTHLKETALRLQQTLQNFGVKVTVTDISQGPSVTRYELQPEQGVKVSKIVGLTDDIKLNLAATDIRIEAPIPGKAAIGIEVPNKENSPVAFRDLIESDSFKKFSSNIAFAVGKDIGGQVVVTDIAKMPHLLIAGATGSGKSVCINTIIMSILYKADPADVKMILIDPKVVELSVYNGIPHLMIPVVTDPKKASAALHWGVAEMTERYKRFADLNVRDLKGYNKAAESGKTTPDGEPLQKMPQIVIIVDELADLMMVAAGEVEESICRLAQLARAAGIHLIIATQRPSVDVITGLIKANMPSRIAFSVSSGVDSRTILDTNGAEKLLGKGDMLFYPQGYSKPARVQGAFVSDSEVSDVVEFIKNQMLGNNTYNSDVEQKIQTMQSSGASPTGSGGNSEYDAYFADAGRFVIEKDKASIGMLQRVFKIGFNRAARIVDQLEAAGVVSSEDGTKPRKILMSMEQFDNFVEESV